MVAQKDRFAAKITRERSLTQQYNSNPYKMERLYEPNEPRNFPPQPWYEMSIDPPDGWTEENFRQCWNFQWGESQKDFCLALAKVLGLRENDGSLKPPEKAAECLIKDLQKHGKLRYCYLQMLWAIHRLGVMSYYQRDRLFVQSLINRDMAA